MKNWLAAALAALAAWHGSAACQGTGFAIPVDESVPFFARAEEWFARHRPMRDDTKLGQRASIIVTFLPAGMHNGDLCMAWTYETRRAYSHAVDLWSLQLASAVPIYIEACLANNFPNGKLGHARPTEMRRDFTGAPLASTWYPVALANALAGSRLSEMGQPDIYAAISGTEGAWYFGIDGKTPAGQLDFVTAAMHGIATGLGFASSFRVSGGVGSWGLGTGMPFVFDRFVKKFDGTFLTDARLYPNPSTALAVALQSDVVFAGTNLLKMNGASVLLYPPSSGEAAASPSNLAETERYSFSALMTSGLSQGGSWHDGGPVAVGILRDLGWTVLTGWDVDLALTITTPTQPISTGRDVIFYLDVKNSRGPGWTTGTRLTAEYEGSASLVHATWCLQRGTSKAFDCGLGLIRGGETTRAILVLRPDAPGALTVRGFVDGTPADTALANNSSSLSVNVSQSPAGVPVVRHRLYSPVTGGHLYTTDANEYRVLSALTGTWIDEAATGKVLDNPGSFNGVAAVPLYRYYEPRPRRHRWTSDPLEYYTRIIGFHYDYVGEGIDGFIVSGTTVGTRPHFRLGEPNFGYSLFWTDDSNERDTLIRRGWADNGREGYVIE